MSESLIKNLTLRRLTKACPQTNAHCLAVLVDHEYKQLYSTVEPLLLGSVYFVAEPLFQICFKKSSKNNTDTMNHLNND